MSGHHDQMRVAVLTSLLACATLGAGPGTQPAALPADDPRRGAVVTVEPDKNQYFLGENVLLNWCIRNAGDAPFRISMGADGRTPWAKRAIRFKVEAVDAQGRLMEDPFPNPPNFGGMGSEPMLEPGQDFRDVIQLMRYREFPTTGNYTIKVYHDLGWEQGSDPPRRADSESSAIPTASPAPVVMTILSLVMPDEKQARQVVDTMLILPADGNRLWGQWGKPFADFELLRYPVYLPIMKEMAQKGDARGLDAIGSMLFPEATAALLELTTHKDPSIATKAMDLLLWRLPMTGASGSWSRPHNLEGAWTEELKKAALRSAWKLLESNDRDQIIRGARIVQSLGGIDDLPALIKVMDRVLPAFQADPIEQKAYLRPATASDALVNAVRELIQRGAATPIAADTPGRAAAFLIGLGLKADFRPEGWQTQAVGLVNHPIPFLRELALLNMPLPLDETATAVVARAIKDEFEPVQGAACTLAVKTKSVAMGPPAMDLLRTTENDWILRAAFRAAGECGIENDRRLEVCVGRMKPLANDLNMLLLSLLIDGSIRYEGGYGSQRIDDWTGILPGIQKAWLDFIATNRQALQNGTHFTLAQPPLTPEMFPPHFSFSRAGQPEWPHYTPPPLTPAELDALEKQSLDFMNTGVGYRIKEWRESQPKAADELEKYPVELVINLDPPEFLLKDGTDRVRRAGLSTAFAWTLYRVTPEGAQRLQAPVRLKLQGLAAQPNVCKEVFVFQGRLEGDRGVYAELTTHNLRFKAGTGVANLAGYQFPDQDFTPTFDSVNQSLLVARPVKATTQRGR